MLLRSKLILRKRNWLAGAILSTIILLGCLCLPVYGEWPEFRKDSANTGYTPLEGPDSGQLQWSYETDGMISSSPAVDDYKVYVGSDDRSLYCIDALTGEFLWKYTTGHVITSSPSVADGRVYVGSKDTKVYCLDATSGSLVWRYKTGGYVLSSPTVDNGKVYVGSYDNKMYCLNALNGSLIWSYRTNGYVYSSPAVDDDMVYFGSGDRYVYCLDATDGSLEWKYQTQNAVYSSPAVDDGAVYVGSVDTYVYSLDALNGILNWKYKTGGWVTSSPAVHQDKVFVGSQDDYLYCIKDGVLVWRYLTGGDVDSSPAVADDYVYVGSDDGYVYCLFSTNGTMVWSHMTGGEVYSSPAVSDIKVYVGSKDNWLYCFADDRLNLRAETWWGEPLYGADIMVEGDYYQTPTTLMMSGNLSLEATPREYYQGNLYLFDHWKDMEGTEISNESMIDFYVEENVTITAVYKPRTANLKVKVYENVLSGPLAGANVSIDGTWTQVTNSTGETYFTDVFYGRHIVTVEHNAFFLGRVVVRIPSTSSVEVWLDPRPYLYLSSKIDGLDFYLDSQCKVDGVSYPTPAGPIYLDRSTVRLNVRSVITYNDTAYNFIRWDEIVSNTTKSYTTPYTATLDLGWADYHAIYGIPED